MEEKVMKDCKVLALCSQKGGVGKTSQFFVRVLQVGDDDDGAIRKQ